ncbi:acyltransferase family protein [Streptomyces sp. NBC_00576]|uniref:acyltransferase family protein n=1 Tax=Streptomyces sp. NBC_00576 TaxID=2903665 RepID=UPI002E818FD6|nr:acyltransferase family protein [Streptomyces sp. NBC_00576]WUB74525.1 acyltransferase [Streptomyces sp. NBC_00576]
MSVSMGASVNMNVTADADGKTRPTESVAGPRLDIQGLRAVAVTLVVLGHARVRGFGGGYVGVDVFFVISGFLITSLLVRELATSDGLSIRRFYARRALRLLPASTLVVVATLAGSWLFLSRVRFEEYAGDALSSALYAVNLRLAASGTDYLAEGSPPSPFQHFWSLAVEEQFYLLWPLLLLLSWRLARRRRELLAVPLAVLCVLSFGLSVAVTEHAPSWAYFGSHTRFWELGAGALLALSAGRLHGLPGRLAAPMTWTGLACIVVSAAIYDNDTPFPGYHALLPVLGSVLVLAGGCAPSRRDAQLVLARRPLVWLGGLSYGWYLWHWPLLLIGPAALGRLPGTPSVRLALLLCALALPLAWVTLRLVENPVRFHSAFRGRPGRALRLGAGLSAGAALIAVTAYEFPPPIDSGRPAPSLRQEMAAAPDPQLRLRQLLETSSTRLPSNLAPPLPEIKSARSAVYRDGCHVAYGSTSVPPCEYGDPASRKVVVLFGDSHAAQWFPALNRLAKERGWKLVSLTKASCKAAKVTLRRFDGPYEACDTWRANAITRIAALRPALVIVSSSDAGDPLYPEPDPVRQWTDGFRATYDALGASGAKVVALLDTPWPRSDAVDCAAMYSLRLDRCATRLPEAIRDRSRRTATRDAARLSGATVIDPMPWLCTGGGDCPVLVGNTVAYRDDSHVSDAYAEAVAPVLGARLS